MSGEYPLSRRSVLLGGAAGLGGLAGCAGTDFDLGGTPSFDRARLQRIADRPIPATDRPPLLQVPRRRIETHRERARELLAALPPEPTVSNGAVTSRLAELIHRARTVITEDEPSASRWDQLENARYARSSAAEAATAYRAAKGILDPSTLATRRGSLRSELSRFRRHWGYRGADPFEALAVHGRLEDLVGSVESATRIGVIPGQPTAAPLRLGEIAAALERGRAALGDARAIRARYLDARRDTQPYRAVFATAGSELEDPHRQEYARIADYLGEEAPDRIGSPGRPAAFLLVTFEQAVGRWREMARESRSKERWAAAVRQRAVHWVYLEGALPMIRAIRDGAYRPPESAAAIEEAKAEAVQRLEEARAVDPRPFAALLARRPRSHIGEGDRYVGGPDGSVEAVYRGYAAYATGMHVAEAVPSVVDAMAGLLRRLARRRVEN